MKKYFKLIIAAALTTTAQILPAADVFVEGDNVRLDFRTDTGHKKGKYIIKRSTGRFSEFHKIGETKIPSFVDKNTGGTPYAYYYLITTAAGDTVATLSPTGKLFGPDIIIYSQSDDPKLISREVNAIHDSMFSAEMSPERHAIFFLPGDYTDAGLMKIGFYTQMSGFGKVPYDVKIDNIHIPPHLKDDNGTHAFWRSAENFSVVGKESYDHDEMFNWAVSQAAPFRRMYSQRTVRYQWKQGWVSGGYTADCVFDAPAGSDGQQQWYTRNSLLRAGRGKFSEGAFNYVLSGVELGDRADKASYADSDWDTGGNVTFIETTPAIREKPFLFIGDDGRYKVFRPALRRDSKGVSFTPSSMGDGEILDLLDTFMVAHPTDSAADMNAALASGKNLLLTPGTYELSEPLRVSRDNAIVMGIGWATLVAPENAEAAMIVGDAEGVQIASLLFDAHHSSRTLMRVGTKGDSTRHADNPTVLSDIFFRIGGFLPKKVNVDCAMEINSNDVIGDHFWIWRADHGVPQSVGWDVNTSDHGLVVNGAGVSIYGLFVEHFQKYQTLWNGEDGRVYFYQSETPYDARCQEEFMSENGTRAGYASYKVADSVHRHHAYGLGIYDVLFNDIMLENSVEVPDRKGIEIHHIVNSSFIPGPKKGFKNIINGKVESTYSNPGHSAVRTNHFSGKD